MKTLRFAALALLALPLIGASKCNPPVPPTPPDISGDWQWTCSDGSTTQADFAAMAGPTCAQQVSQNSPFMKYVKEYISFKKDTLDWTALFAFGSCVDSQTGKYTYENSELKILDTQGVVAQTYTVTQPANTPDQLIFKQPARTCTLNRSAVPQPLTGNHPRPQATKIDWDLRVDQNVTRWFGYAQFPFVYQTPQLQANVKNPTSYKVGYTVLSISTDGSQLPHYAAYVQLYDNAGQLLAVSEVQELAVGATFTIEYNTADGHEVVLSGVFSQ